MRMHFCCGGGDGDFVLKSGKLFQNEKEKKEKKKNNP